MGSCITDDTEPVCYAEKRFFKWVEDNTSVTLRSRSGSYGGGSEVLILQHPKTESQNKMRLAIGVDMYNQSLTGNVAKSLTSIATDSDHIPCVLVLNDQGGGIMNVSYDVTATLRSQMKHHEPVILDER